MQGQDECNVNNLCKFMSDMLLQFGKNMMVIQDDLQFSTMIP
jgi:hypothetical protein